MGWIHKRFWSPLSGGGGEAFSFLITNIFPNTMINFMPEKLGSLKRKIIVLFQTFNKHEKHINNFFMFFVITLFTNSCSMCIKANLLNRDWHIILLRYVFSLLKQEKLCCAERELADITEYISTTFVITVIKANTCFWIQWGGRQSLITGCGCWTREPPVVYSIWRLLLTEGSLVHTSSHARLTDISGAEISLFITSFSLKWV